MAKGIKKAKTVSILTKFKGGTPKASRQVKGDPEGKVLAKRGERGTGLKFDVKTFQTVASFKPGTKIKYGPNPKTPGSKSFDRYKGYQNAKTVGEALKGGSKLADLCWELDRGIYKILGGERSEAAERGAIGDKWFDKAQKLLSCFQGPRGLNVKLNDPKAKEALAKEEAWREKKLKKVEELARKYKIKIENEEELNKLGIHEAHELHAERKVCDQICKIRLDEAAKAKKKITDENLDEAMGLWGFSQNTGRLNVMREGVKYVYSDTIGAIRRRCQGYGITPPTRHYPNFVRLLCKWLVDNHLEKKLGCDFKFTAINLNANYAGARHRDGNNEGPSVIRAVGNFQGGRLKYWPTDIKRNPRPDVKTLTDKPVIHDLKKNTTIFDGTRAHEVEDFKGDRYSIVYFSASGYPKVKDKDSKYLIKLGMPWPTPKEMEGLKKATKNFIEGKTFLNKVRKSALKRSGHR